MKLLRKIGKYLGFVLGFIFIIHILMVIFIRPSLNRDWTADQKVLAEAFIDGDKVNIKNIRNIKYRTKSDYDVAYYDKTFDLNKLDSVWFMVEPFSGHGFGAAHTLVSFGFEGGSYVSISVEIRKEEGESFSVQKGLLRQFELVYVIADEKDVIKLRSNYRKDKVFLYPVLTDKENMRKLFVSMLNRNNKLAKEPEFYNTLTSTCTTNIVSHVNEISKGRIPLSYKVLMPAYSDEFAQKIGLIEQNIPIDKLREKYLINEKAEKYADDENWSKRIRE